MQKRSVLLMSLAVVVASAGAAWGGTKYQANIVPSTTSTQTVLTTSKGKVKADSKGKMQVSMKGVLAGGQPITTDGSFNDKTSPTLTGDEYVAIISGEFLALGVPFEFALPMEVKGGSGKAKIDASDLFSLIPPGTAGSVSITGTEIHGPLGGENVAGCEAVLVGGGFSLPPAPNPCVAGELIGAAGFEIE